MFICDYFNTSAVAALGLIEFSALQNHAYCKTCPKELEDLHSRRDVCETKAIYVQVVRKANEIARMKSWPY